MDSLITGLLVLSLVELLVSVRWWPPYYKHGLLLYREKMALAQASTSMPTAQEFAEAFRASVAFRSIGAHEMAFREAFLGARGFAYAPIMHGLVRIDPVAHEVVVEGRANWYPAAFFVFGLLFLWAGAAWLMLIVLVAFLWGTRQAQTKLFRQVGEFVAA